MLSCSTKQPAVISSPNINILDKQFFTAPIKTEQKQRRINQFTVHQNEDFGFTVKFTPSVGTARMKVRLVVPSKPNNFPCPKCLPGELLITDDHTVEVNTKIDLAKGHTGFYWGIDANDPKGQYELSYYLEDSLIETYRFEVQ